MIDAYAIGASLTLDDKIFGQLQQVSDKFDVVQQAIDKINGSLKETVGLVGQARSGANSMASAFERAATAAERMQRAAGGMGGFGGGGYGGGGGAMPLPVPIDRSDPANRYLPYDAPANLPAVITGQGSYSGGGPQPWGHVPITGYGQGGTPPGGDGGGYGGGGQNFTMDGGYGGGGGGGPDAPFNDPNAPRWRGGNSGSGGGSSSMDLMGKVFVAQAGANIASDAVSTFTAPSFDLQQQQANLKNMGASPTDISKAMAAAVAIQKQYPGITIGQATAEIANLYSVDRNMTDVVSLAPGYAEAGYVISKSQNGADANGQLYSILRSSEEAGKFNLLNKNGTLNTSNVVSFIDMYAKLIANSNGNLTGAGALQMTGQAGPGITQLNNTALERMILISQSLGPSATGTGLNAMDQEFLGGKMSQATARNLHEAGLLPDYMFGPHDGKILKKYQTGIGQVRIPVGALVDQTGFLEDPFKWETDHIMKNYLNPDGTVKKGTPKDKVQMIATLVDDYSRITGQKLAGINAFNAQVVNRAIVNASDMAPLSVLAANDASTAKSRASGAGAAVDAFLQALGSPLLPGATKGLTMLTTTLNDMSDRLRAHPDETMAGEGVVATVLGYLGIKYGGRAAGALARKVGLTGARGAAGEAESVSGLEIGAAGAATGGVLSGGLGLAGLLYLGWKQVEGMSDLPLPFTKGAAAYNQKIKDGPTGAPDQPLSVRISNLPAFLSALAAHQGQEAAQMPSSPTGFNLSGSAPPAPGQPLGVR